MSGTSFNSKLLREREDIAQYLGVYVSMEELVMLQSSHATLDLSGKRKALAAMTGAHRSAFRGRGIDFDEVRIYNPGDDVRTIDWRVTARTGITHTKLFREERERPIYLVVDQSHSMFFGTRHAFKSVVAARAAAKLAWAAREHGDRVGGFLFNDEVMHEIRPKEGKRGIQQFLRLLIQFNQSLNNIQPENPSRGAISTALTGLNQVIKPGSLVFVISDFKNFDDITLQHLSIVSRHSDMVALFVYDPMEEHLPPPGEYGFTDGSRSVNVQTSNREVRKNYRKRFLQHQLRLRDQLSSIAIPTIELSTEDDINLMLGEKLGVRGRGPKAR